MLYQSKIPGVIFYPLNINSDCRGLSTELFRDDQEEDTNIKMGYLSWTKPDEVRGPHEHAEQSDLFIFPGPGVFLLRLWDFREVIKDQKELEEWADKNSESHKVGDSMPVKVSVPPGVVHAYKNISDISSLCINFPNELYRGWKKAELIDEKRWEKHPDNPFKI